LTLCASCADVDDRVPPLGSPPPPPPRRVLKQRQLDASPSTLQLLRDAQIILVGGDFDPPPPHANNLSEKCFASRINCDRLKWLKEVGGYMRGVSESANETKVLVCFQDLSSVVARYNCASGGMFSGVRSLSHSCCDPRPVTYLFRMSFGCHRR